MTEYLPAAQSAHAVPTMMEPEGHFASQSDAAAVEVRPVVQVVQAEALPLV